jgi:hypothetical protein
MTRDVIPQKGFYSGGRISRLIRRLRRGISPAGIIKAQKTAAWRRRGGFKTISSRQRTDFMNKLQR